MKNFVRFRKLILIVLIFFSMVSYVCAASNSAESLDSYSRIEFVSTGQHCPICDSDDWAVVYVIETGEIIAQQCVNCAYCLLGRPILP